MTNLLLPIAAFVCTGVADVVWVRWQQSVATGHPHAAAAWSVAIIVCGSVLTLTIVDKNPIAYLAALAGAYAGTWWAVHAE